MKKLIKKNEKKTNLVKAYYDCGCWAFTKAQTSGMLNKTSKMMGF